MEDHPLTLTAKVTGLPRPEVAWLKNDKELAGSPNVKMSYDGDHCMLVIKKAKMDLDGAVKCVATNPAGTAELVCRTTVEGRHTDLKAIFLYGVSLIPHVSGRLCTNPSEDFV